MSPDEQDDHFVAYSKHTVDALESSDIRVPMCIGGTTFYMQLDTAADVSLLPESLYLNHSATFPFRQRVLTTTINSFIPLCAIIETEMDT